MTNDSDRNELLEIYKLHAELADRVSQRRERANRLYVSLLAGLAAFLAVLIRFGVGGVPVQVWYVVLRSYRQLNTGKFQALHELENRLAYPFFRREWELLGEGEDRSRYWRLTVVEVGLPCIFFVLFVALSMFSFFTAGE